MPDYKRFINELTIIGIGWKKNHSWNTKVYCSIKFRFFFTHCWKCKDIVCKLMITILLHPREKSGWHTTNRNVSDLRDFFSLYDEIFCAWRIYQYHWKMCVKDSLKY